MKATVSPLLCRVVRPAIHVVPLTTVVRRVRVAELPMDNATMDSALPDTRAVLETSAATE